MQAIFNGFTEIIGSLKALLEGTMMFIKWIPQLIGFTNSLAISNAIPGMFLPCAMVILVIYILKIVLGGDNGS